MPAWSLAVRARQARISDVGGHQQQRDEQGAGGDVADPAAGGGGEGFVGGVFDESVEAFDGVAQGGYRACRAGPP